MNKTQQTRIELPKQVSKFEHAVAFMYKNTKELLLAKLAPAWLFGCDTMTKIPFSIVKSQKPVIFNGHPHPMFENIDNLKLKTQDRYGIDIISHRMKAQELNDLISHVLSAISLVDGETNGLILTELLRSTAVRTTDTTVALPYTAILEDKVINNPDVCIKEKDGTLTFNNTINVDSAEDMLALMCTLRLRNLININIAYRIHNNVRFKIGKTTMTLHELSEMSPDSIIDEIGQDEVKIGTYVISRAKKAEIPRNLWNNIDKHERNRISVVRGPAFHSLYIGRTILFTGSNQEWAASMDIPERTK